MSDTSHLQDDEPGPGPDGRTPQGDDLRATPPGDAHGSTEQDLGLLAALLRRTEQARRAPWLLEGALWFALAQALLVLIATWLSSAWPALVLQGLPRALVLGGAALITLGAIASLVVLVGGRVDLLAIASRLQRAEPGLRNDLAASLEFGEKIRAWEHTREHDASVPPPSFSPLLASAHIRRTARHLAAMARSGHLGHVLPRKDVTPVAALAAVSLIAVLGSNLYVAGGNLGNLFAWMQRGATGDGQGREVRPIVGSVDLVLTYPAYTGLGQEQQMSTTGHIQALQGTVVTLSTYPLEPVTSLELVLNPGAEEKVVALKPSAAGPWQATLTLSESLPYSFRARLADGTDAVDGLVRTMRVEPDEAPEVVVLEPGTELEVQPDDIIAVRFRVEDDFGLASVDRLTFFAGDEAHATRVAIELPGLAEGERSAMATFSLDLGPLALQPKDVLVLVLEARDNNTATGPGVGRSEPIVLTVASPEDRHLKLLADQQEALEALLLHLADYLEAPVGKRESGGPDRPYRQLVAPDLADEQRMVHLERHRLLVEQGRGLVERLQLIASAMAEDPLTSKRDQTLFTAFVAQLSGLGEDGKRLVDRLLARAQGGQLTTGEVQSLADYAARAEDTLEKGILRYEELIAQQKMEAIEATAQNIRELKDRLRELLEQYRDTQDPALKDAIRREIQRLRQRMAELMQRMQMQLEKLPEEHVNLEALQQAAMESDTRKLSDQLASVEEMLEKDDIDGALKALDEMDSALDELTREMDEQFDAAQPEGLSELDQKVSELMDGVNDLEQMQQAIEKETRELYEQMTQGRQEQDQRALKPVTDRMLSKLAEQNKALERMAQEDLPQRDQSMIQDMRRQMGSLKKMLEQQDIEQSLQQARHVAEQLRTMGFSLELSQRYAPPGSPEARALGESRRQMQDMVPRGQEMVQELEGMMAEAQGRGATPAQNQRMEELAGRQQQARQQADQLQQKIGEASERFPMLGPQLGPSMHKAQQSMQEAGQSLGKGRGQQALDHERDALEQLGQLKQSMRDAMQKQRQPGDKKSGGRQMSKDKVQIPSQDGRQAHEKFRREIMEGMREGRPENYESEIERYYKSLME